MLERENTMREILSRDENSLLPEEEIVKEFVSFYETTK